MSPVPDDETLGRRLRRVALDVVGWVLTVVGVVAIIVVVGRGDADGSTTLATLVAVAIALAALVPVAVGVAYVLVRRRNRGLEDSDARAVSARANAAQALLASAVDRMDDSTADALGLRRMVLTDRVRLTPHALADLDDRWEALAFIWYVRPSQPDDFPTSPQLAALPSWAQDAVVLLDLRREVALHGASAALARPSGFYHHPFDRVREAADRTGSHELVGALLEAATEGTAEQCSRLAELLDDEDVWVGLLGPRPAD